MKPYDIVLLTEAKYMNPTEVDWYTKQVLVEDGLVQAALEKKGLTVKKMNWDAPDFDWASTRAIIFRTPWDYSERFDEFSVWLEQVVTQTHLINSQAQINWNIDKHYLLDLQKKGIRIPLTKIIDPQSKTSLSDLQKELGWKEMVLKPTVSAAGRHTYRLTPENIESYESLFQTLIAKEAMMLQPFLYNITKKGEVAFMLIDGKYTHAVLKKAKKGDFRVQDDFGGSVEVYQPSKEEIEFAEKAVAACSEMPTYARVDMVWDNEDQMALSEIELIEPEMWFRNAPSAADELAEVIVTKIIKQ
ncbi:ATP-grasp domain-containing protein [Aureispira anguillae]|uniref:Prokaryotic glutathione synthetase ATP-binding domain-containing protein n=1 Tax=Aureispira anguillae TaxID=2864201 RepID=A0A915YKA8_9BACT|nr:hypothetical protein [Aureispira anguillae]BDS14527.1 hypothetical protein AsAng_0053070 [Aureispira anguillae]